jgi:hypothetical protein
MNMSHFKVLPEIASQGEGKPQTIYQGYVWVKLSTSNILLL